METVSITPTLSLSPFFLFVSFVPFLLACLLSFFLLLSHVGSGVGAKVDREDRIVRQNSLRPRKTPPAVSSRVSI